MAQISLEILVRKERSSGSVDYLHWLAVAALLEDFRGHVSRCTACSGQYVELLLVHNPGQAKVGDQKVRIVLWRAEQQVLGLQVPVDNSVVMEIGHG